MITITNYKGNPIQINLDLLCTVEIVKCTPILNICGVQVKCQTFLTIEEANAWIDKVLYNKSPVVKSTYDPKTFDDLYKHITDCGSYIQVDLTSMGKEIDVDNFFTHFGKVRITDGFAPNLYDVKYYNELDHEKAIQCLKDMVIDEKEDETKDETEDE